RRGRIGSKGFAQALLALQQKVHLRAKGGAGFLLVKIGEEGIVFAIVNALGVQAFGQDAGQGGFADAERAFDGDEARSLWTPLGDRCALGRGVVRYWLGIIAVKMFAFDVIPRGVFGARNLLLKKTKEKAGSSGLPASSRQNSFRNDKL